MQIGQLVPTPSPSSWAQIFCVDLKGKGVLSSQGQLVVVLELTAPAGFDLALTGKAVFEKINQVLVASPKGLSVGLSEALGSAKVVFEERLHLAHDPAVVSFSTVALVVGNGNASLGQFGGAYAGLWRRGHFHVFLTDQTEQEIVSGPVKVGDILVLATPAFVNHVSRGEMTDALVGGDPAEAVASLAPRIHASGVNGRAAAALIRIEPSDLARLDLAQEMISQPDDTKSPVFTLKRLAGRTLLGWQAAGRFLKTRFLARLPFSARLGFPKIYVRGDKTEIKRAKLRLVFLVLASLLILSVWQGMVGRRLEQQSEDLKQLVAQAEQRYQEATSLADLNPIRSRSLLQEAQGLLDQVITTQEARQRWRLPWLSRFPGSGRAPKLRSQIDELMMDVSRRFAVQPELVVDLSRLTGRARGQVVSRVKDQLFVVDPGRGAVYRVNPQTRKSEELVVDDRLKDLVDVSQEYVLTKEAIFRVGPNGQLRQVVKETGQWVKPVALERFGVNLYVLDPGSNQIHKYVGLEDGFSSAQPYLTEEMDLKKTLDMAIDGRIWLATSEGEIFSFLGGKAQVFLITGLDQPFSAEVRIFTSPEAENLYILDRGNQRVVVFNKDGDYQVQYHNTALAEATDLVVDEELGKIWIIRSSRVEEIRVE